MEPRCGPPKKNVGCADTQPRNGGRATSPRSRTASPCRSERCVSPATCGDVLGRSRRLMTTEELEEMEIERKRKEVRVMMRRNRLHMEKHQGTVRIMMCLAVPISADSCATVAPPEPSCDAVVPELTVPSLRQSMQKRTASPAARPWSPAAHYARDLTTAPPIARPIGFVVNPVGCNSVGAVAKPRTASPRARRQSPQRKRTSSIPVAEQAEISPRLERLASPRQHRAPVAAQMPATSLKQRQPSPLRSSIPVAEQPPISPRLERLASPREYRPQRAQFSALDRSWQASSSASRARSTSPRHKVSPARPRSISPESPVRPLRRAPALAAFPVLDNIEPELRSAPRAWGRQLEVPAFRIHVHEDEPEIGEGEAALPVQAHERSFFRPNLPTPLVSPQQLDPIPPETGPCQGHAFAVAAKASAVLEEWTELRNELTRRSTANKTVDSQTPSLENLTVGPVLRQGTVGMPLRELQVAAVATPSSIESLIMKMEKKEVNSKAAASAFATAQAAAVQAAAAQVAAVISTAALMQIVPTLQPPASAHGDPAVERRLSDAVAIHEKRGGVERRLSDGIRHPAKMMDVVRPNGLARGCGAVSLPVGGVFQEDSSCGNLLI